VEFRRTPDGCFTDLPGFAHEPKYLPLGDGLRMHFIDEGPPAGAIVLLLHGQPTWSFLYRQVIPVLTSHSYRVIAPDLIGFGRSDKPTGRSAYTVRSHIRWLREFIETLDLTAITMVVQDWGGPLGLAALAASPGRFARIVATNTALHTADAALADRLTWACHATGDGTVVVQQDLLDYQRLTQELTPWRPSLFLQGATEGTLEPAVLAAYDAPFPDESYCAGPRQLPLLMGLTPGSECARSNRRTMAALGDFRGPLLTAFSDGDPSTRGWERVLQQAVPGAFGQAHVVIRQAGHFVQEDRGAELAEVVTQFMQRTPART
jgi:haloalkane dehalogenase